MLPRRFLVGKGEKNKETSSSKKRFFACPTLSQLLNIPSSLHRQVPYIDSPFAHSILSILCKASSSFHSSIMVPELQKPRVTEIQVRMDCNGCVQKIKKALHGINGIYDLYIDFPQQKITIIGWADPEKIVKAIKKTRKTAIICSHTEPPDEPPAQQPSEQANQGEAPPTTESAANPPPPESSNPPPTEPPPTEAAPPTEPPKDQPAPQENPKPEAKPSPDEGSASPPPVQPAGPKDVEEVHVIYHHPPDYGYRYGYNHHIGHGYGGQWHSYPSGPSFRHEPTPPPPPPPPPQVAVPPVYVTHSYNTHRATPYVTGYEYVRPPPLYTHYNPMERYIDDYQYHQGNNGNGNVTAIFSDENPNACTIV
ncbi:hypothetical protein M9H77_36872 [Catharanthus roseus]|uniref:Uncharacterized protein n=1 Tax=Catharanthus roseus TaxID=4058 RepID=A0ACB9ZXB7_CATRO|nr:hypothetical protein M9H77_36872 [Catharanthus roseus]